MEGERPADPGSQRDTQDTQDTQDDLDDLDGFETASSRFAARVRWLVVVVVALGLLVPAGRWALDELAFGAAGDAVEERLGDEAGLAEALVLVRTVDCSGRSSSGSAFALDLDGEPVLVTNRHVVEDARMVSVRPFDGGPAVPVGRHLVAASADVAVLELVDATEVPPTLPLGPAARSGEEVRTVGFPGGRPSTTAGPVAELAADRMILDLVIDPGASGSPVLDDAGQVVGQVFARMVDGRGIATPRDALVAAISAAEPAPACDA